MDDDTDFNNEEDLLSYVEERLGQLNSELDDLEKSQFSESGEDFEGHSERIAGEIGELQEVIKKNYVRLAGGEGKITSWEDIDMYSSTITLLERLTEIRDTNTSRV